ncbi:unnamed protein product [Parnassius apollo]|uniref:(apollo) hypothetical protein n=1 Tax=Parnassius apollo TaxID=110799 RepID=A0A8S3W4U6_PARAO|nr:unnamed protein product [Parnassius apollo]
MNHSKASVSIMMSATAAGDILPPYVVYKAQNLYDTWTENGPPGTRLPVEDCGEEVEKSILDLLKELRYGTTTVKQSTRKRKLNVIAGRSVGDGTEGKNSSDYDETEDYVDSEDRDFKNKKRKEASKGTEISKKGKGKGKKSNKQNESNAKENVIDQNEKNTEETEHNEENEKKI